MLKKIKDKIVKYCFWTLNNHLKVEENFPQPIFFYNPKVEGLFVRFYKNKDLRGSAGTTSPVSLLQGLKGYTINSASFDLRFPKITNPEELTCQVSILQNVQKMENKMGWFQGTHGLKSKSGQVFLPHETLLRTKEQTVRELGNNPVLRFETTVLEDSYYGSNPNPKTAYYLKLMDVLINYFNPDEYDVYTNLKRMLLKAIREDQRSIKMGNLSEKIKNVLKAEFFNLHKVILFFENSVVIKINVAVQIRKSDMMSYVDNKIKNFGSVLDDFMNYVDKRRERKFNFWEVYCKQLSVVKSYFYFDTEMRLTKYIKFKGCKEIPYVRLSFQKSDFKNKPIPEGLKLPFIFHIFTLNLENNDLRFIYPDVGTESNLEFLLTVVTDFDDIFNYQKKKRFDTVYVPAFMAEFYDDQKFYTVNTYGVFEYENGIHKLSEKINYPSVNIIESDKVLVLNRPFVCFLGPLLTTIVTHPQNPFKSRARERYLWKFRPDISKLWNRKYVSLLK